MRQLFLCLLSLIFLSSCKKYCNKILHYGEILEIPIQFKGFSENEIRSVRVYRISHQPNEGIDSMRFSDLLLSFKPNDENIYKITDNNRSSRQYGYYESYLHECDLIFDWFDGSDTLKNFIILKSKKETNDECHKDDPNIRIDKVSFEHKNKTYSKKEIVQFFK